MPPTTLPAHRFPPLSPIPPSSRPEGLAGDEVTSPLKPHPASTPSLGIRKYDRGISSPRAGAARVVAGLPLCLSLSWESPGPGRNQNLPQSPQEEEQNLDILYHWLGWKVTGVQYLSGKPESSLEGQRPFQQEPLSWHQRPGSNSHL